MGEPDPRRGAKAIAIGASAGGRRARTLPMLRAGLRLLAAFGQAFVAEIDRRRLFLWLPVFYAVGIAAYFAAEREPSPYASAIPLSAFAVLAFISRARMERLAPILAATMLFAGFFAATIRTIVVSAPVLKAPASITLGGTIESVDRTPYGLRMIVAVADMEPRPPTMPARVRVIVRDRQLHESGAGVIFRARLMPPSPPAVPGGFDFQRDAYFQRLGAVGTVTGPIERASQFDAATPGARMSAGIERARNGLTARIVAVIGGSTGAIAAALVTGKRGEISERDNESWRAAGVYHIISISGLHMMLAAGLFFWSARVILALLPGFSLRHSTKKHAAVVAMLGATAYNMFSGGEVAAERALIMTLVMLGAILVDRPALAMRNLAISAFIVLSLRPETLLGPSFQMSFGAVAGLIAYGETMRALRERNLVSAHAREDGWATRGGRLLLDFVATSLIAGLATAPFQAYHFHRLNPYGLLGNTLAIPLCSFLVMPAALLGVLLYPLGLDAPAWWAMGQGVAMISHAAFAVAQLEGAIAAIGRYSTGAMILLALAITIFCLMSTATFKALAVLPLTIGLGLAVRTPRPDLIIDATGGVAMARGADGKLALLGARRPEFILQQWLSGDRDKRAANDASLAQGVRCDRSGCVLEKTRAGAIALVRDHSAFTVDCERADVVITHLDAPPHCRGPGVIYDRSHFDRHGATYVYAGQGDRTVETARHERAQRPWLPMPRAPARPATTGVFNQTTGSRPPPTDSPPDDDTHQPPP